jgi:hypothetical protein
MASYAIREMRLPIDVAVHAAGAAAGCSAHVMDAYSDDTNRTVRVAAGLAARLAGQEFEVVPGITSLYFIQTRKVRAVLASRWW